MLEEQFEDKKQHALTPYQVNTHTISFSRRETPCDFRRELVAVQWFVIDMKSLYSDHFK